MAELKKFTSFEALKLEGKPAGVNEPKSSSFHELEAFLKRLQNEYSNKKKTKINYGKQLGR